ncbi:MAG: DNA mismatch repair endonuclease MutL [Nitrospinota bacterium]|nr:DNA mismatch repair endonuclease MutL [Nitrospinota bacterium]
MGTRSIIRILPENVSNQIAAGEVVQRPASIVKELVENSLDAGAKRISIFLKSGGRRGISVVDDGIGMSRDDALLSLERHATSKISTEIDLHNIATMGFRGEALPSISSVSKVTLKTKREVEEDGTEIRIEGGRILKVSEVGIPLGTEIEVSSLFYNLPARRKFLKRRETEFARCSEIVNRLSLSRPDVGFRFFHDDRKILDLGKDMDRFERLSSLLGKETLPFLIELPDSGKGEDLSFSGWTSAPVINRSNRNSQYLFVNGRAVRDRLLSHAVFEAYRSFLPLKRFPLYCFFIDLPCGDVDVNVHPAKEEVRFRNPSEIYETLRNLIVSSLEAKASPRKQFRQFASVSMREDTSYDHGTAVVEPKHEPLLTRGGYFKTENSLPNTDFVPEQSQQSTSDVLKEPSEESNEFSYESFLEPPHPKDPVILSQSRYLGQWRGCFLMFAAKQGLVFVDQHAAHERVLYNKFRHQFRDSNVESQGLLVPHEMSFNPEESACIEVHKETLLRSGFSIEMVGPGEFFIHSMPALLKNQDPSEVIRTVVENLSRSEGPISFPDMIDGIIARMSCRRSVKAEKIMHAEEVSSLIDSLEKTPAQWTCPHGRPLMLVLSESLVRKKFLRT